MKVNKLYLIVTLSVVSTISLSSLTGCAGATPIPKPTPTAPATAMPARTDRIQLWGNGYWYLLGVNYPWLNYGHDFGTTAWGHDGASSRKSGEQIDADFAYLKSQGMHVVRWFLFGDGRAAPEFNAKGEVTGFDEYFYPDLEAALATGARKKWLAVRYNGDLSNTKVTALVHVPVDAEFRYADAKLFLFDSKWGWRESGSGGRGVHLEPGEWVELSWDLRRHRTFWWPSP